MADQKVSRPRTSRPKASGAKVEAEVAGAASVVKKASKALAEEVASASATVAETIEAAPSPAEQSDPVALAPVVAEPVQEVIHTMATITGPAEATEKMQAMFGDATTRFKGAFEKSTKMGEEMVELTKGNVEAIVASAKVAAKGGEALGQEAADYGKKSLESAMALFKSFASIKSPTELFQLQSDFAKASFDSAVAEASKLSESVLKIAGDVAQPLSSRYAVAADKIKAATL